MLLVSVRAACPVAAESNRVPRITVFSTCDIEAKRVADVVAHISQHHGVQVHSGPCLELEDPDLDKVARSAFGALEPADRFAIVLYDISTNQSARAIRSIEDRAAIINLRVLEVREGKSVKDKDARFAWRIKKEAMRGLGALLGNQRCNTATCALFLHGTPEILDRKGRNLCPPHRVKSDRQLSDLGFRVIPAGSRKEDMGPKVKLDES